MAQGRLEISKGALVQDTTERWPLKAAVESMIEQSKIRRLKD